MGFVWVNVGTTDTIWRHKSKKSANLGRCGRQNMLQPYLKIWVWELIFDWAVKAISSLGIRSPCCWSLILQTLKVYSLSKRRFIAYMPYQNVKNKNKIIFHLSSKKACSMYLVKIAKIWICNLVIGCWIR